MTTPHTHESTAHTEGDEAPGAPRSEWRRQFIGLFIGLGLAVLVFFIFPSNAIETVQGSAGADPEAEYTLSAIRTVAAVTILMGVWWMTEAIPLAATALLGALHEALVGPLAPDHLDDPAKLRDTVQAVTLLALRAVGVMDARARGLVVQAVLPVKSLVGA